jgi:hypothetical protein
MISIGTSRGKMLKVRKLYFIICKIILDINYINIMLLDYKNKSHHLAGPHQRKKIIVKSIPAKQNSYVANKIQISYLTWIQMSRSRLNFTFYQK